MWECQHCTAASNKSLWDELEEDLKIKIINHRNESLEIDKLHSEIETYIQMVYKDARELNIRLSLSAVDESYFQEQMKMRPDPKASSRDQKLQEEQLWKMRPDPKASSLVRQLRENLDNQYNNRLSSDRINDIVTKCLTDEIYKQFTADHAYQWTWNPYQEKDNKALQNLRKKILESGMPPFSYFWGNFDPNDRFWQADFKKSKHEEELQQSTSGSEQEKKPHRFNNVTWTPEGLSRVTTEWNTNWGYDRFGCPKDNAWE
tara:strand:- start:429 stop:1208 length:780 start_codon:yes stop_codon:yes gene_type:complete